MRIIFIPIVLLFVVFLILPLTVLFIRSFETGQGYSVSNYLTILADQEIRESIGNSMKVSGVTAMITTVLAFILAYSIHCTRIYRPLKALLELEF